MENFVQPGPGVHQRQRLLVERVQQVCRVGQGGADALRADRCHLAQGQCPFAGVALDLLRIARVGRAPDEEVAAAQDLAPGNPGPGVVVGFAARVAQFKALAANLQRQMLAEGFVGVAVLSRPDEAGHAELPLVDGGVIACRQAIALKAGDDGFVPDDMRIFQPAARASSS